MTVLLREEMGQLMAIEKELAMFREMEQSKTNRIHQQAKVFKYIAITIALGVTVWAGWLLIRILQKNPNIFNR